LFGLALIWVLKKFFIFTVLGLELQAYTLSHSTSSFFVMGVFEMRFG
jgi:hypothetical protein